VAICLVVFGFWHHSSSVQQLALSKHDALGHSSFPNAEARPPLANATPDSLPYPEPIDTEEDRRREARRREDHLKADQLQEIQTIERHLKEHHQGPAYQPNNPDELEVHVETAEDQQQETQEIQRHLEEEHAEHRQAELKQETSHLNDEPLQPVPRPVVLGSRDSEASPAIEVKLDPETNKEPVIAVADQPKEKVALETEPQAHLSLEEKAELLPEIVHIPFEDAVKDVTLEGWEDEWVAKARFDSKKWGKLKEPKIDFVYLWVNGSEKEFQDTKRPYELNSVLNDVEGKWIKSHGVNRYRDWDELRYSLRSIEKHAGQFRNKIQILVNSVNGTEDGKQIPWWLNAEPTTHEIVQVLAQEEFFDEDKHVCLPTFNSLTIENQIFNTPSDVDHVRLSDEALLRCANVPSFSHSLMICCWESRMPPRTSTPRSLVR
jgi:hypothetical protein